MLRPACEEHSQRFQIVSPCFNLENEQTDSTDLRWDLDTLLFSKLKTSGSGPKMDDDGYYCNLLDAVT